jgi:hypothetical protein
MFTTVPFTFTTEVQLISICPGPMVIRDDPDSKTMPFEVNRMDPFGVMMSGLLPNLGFISDKVNTV